jgi:hypothetical protein
LVNVPDPVTRANKIGISWTAPIFEGGSSITDYQVYYDNANGGASYTVFETSVSDTEYVVLGMTQGQTYSFYVEARNAYGVSFLSNVLSVLAAQEPF